MKFTPLTEPLYQYCLDHQSPFSEPLQALIQATAEHEKAAYASNEQQVAFLQMIARLMNAKRIMEVGVLTGVMTHALAEAIPQDGIIYALEKREDIIEVGKPFWQQAGIDHKIDVRLGEAAPSLEQLINEGIEPIDLVYIDANKGGYVNYFSLSLKLVRSGGVIIADNAFWHGLVSDVNDEHNITRKIRRFNQHVLGQDNGQCVLLPIGDGMMMYQSVSSG